MVVVEVKSGEEVNEALESALVDMGIEKAAIVSVIGAVRSCVISNMDSEDPKNDILNTYDDPFELSGNGEVIDGKPHIHCVVSRENEDTLAGHLHKAVVGDWFVRVYIEKID